jgi:hypothetical protein
VISQLLRSFLPLHNPIGFGAADFIELVLTLSIVLFTWLWRPRVAALLHHLAQRTRLCMVLLAVLPIALRLALLAHDPIPTPAVSDDFSYVLLADTLKHFRLANPTHPLHQFFETFFVLQEPTYSSIFPLGQGLVLAAPGQVWPYRSERCARCVTGCSVPGSRRSGRCWAVCWRRFNSAL